MWEVSLILPIQYLRRSCAEVQLGHVRPVLRGDAVFGFRFYWVVGSSSLS